MKLRMFQVDAFTDRLFAGNPAAVVPLDAWLPDATMQAIAAENNLAETAFFVPLDRGSQAPVSAHYHLRWFTPAVEVQLCGHATLATAHVLVNHLGVDADVLRFDSLSGLLTVARDGARFVLDFPSLPPKPATLPEALSRALRRPPRELHVARKWMAVYDTEEQVRGLNPDFTQLAAIDAFGFIVTAPGRDCDFVSRFFAPRAGIDEDPVTGSAHCTLIPYWAQRLGKTEMFARQMSQRGGELHCRLAGDRVHIGGRAVTYLVGEVTVR